MNSSITVNGLSLKKKSKKRNVFSQGFRVGPVTFIVIAAALVGLIGFLFLAQLFQSSTKGYEITELRNQVDDLKEDNKSLEIRAAELRSFDNIDNSVEELNMVKANNIVYLKKADTSIVVAK